MPTVIVKAIPESGFHRAGRKWTKEPETVDVDATTLAVLKNEPMLIVEQTKDDGGKGAIEKSTDGNVDEAAAKIAEMTDAKEIRKFIKGDDRKGVNEAADARIEALKS